MADLRERLTGENIIEPLTFDEIEIQEFVRANACGFCGGHLFSMHAPDRKYTAHCPEHGAVMDHTHTSNYKAEQAKQNERIGKIELRQPKERGSEEEILSELGY